MSDEHERPAALRTDRAPTDGYVLSVDGKLKARYETADAAAAAALKLKQAYPVLSVQVYDAAARSYTPVLLPESGAAAE